MSKFTLTTADGTTKTYSRKIDATRAGEKADGGFKLVSPKGEVVIDTIPAPAPVAPVLEANEDVDCGGCNNAEHCNLNADETECDCCGAGKAPAPTKRPGKRAERTWEPTDADATRECAGACGETKPAKAFPTTKGGRRGVECRKCRDARLK
ncbi:hypothetical protein NYO98_10565 [Nocardioides sp. STR2]|uniref:Uncharacterized protein n=1 Tax=Nocardioides pini TaxID=2975053 RepID=A0ABT4CD41_9ACTN|nr:hypothetical protein [Nocardioides pini]MCY4726721.1 hypothetical protein [Nocardioides pini]